MSISIPKDKVKQIIEAGGRMDIAAISSALIQSGFKTPNEPQPAAAPGQGERTNPFITSLEACLAEMCKDGVLKSEQVSGKIQYEVVQR